MNESAGYLRKRRRATSVLLFCFFLLLVGVFTTQDVEVLREPIAVPGREELHVLYRNGRAEADSAVFYHLRVRGDSDPVASAQLQGDYRSAVAVGEELWVFFPGTISVLGPGKRSTTRKWPEPWTPSSALPAPGAAGRAWAFGFAPDPLPKDVPPGDRPRPGVIVGAVGAAGDRWDPLPPGPRRTRPIEVMRAVAVGGTVLLFWRETGTEGAAADLYWCRFDGTAWSAVGVLVPGTGMDFFAPVAAGDRVVVFLASQSQREWGRIPAAVMALEGEPRRPLAFSLRDCRVHSYVFGLGACVRGDRVELYFTRDGEVDAARFDASRIPGTPGALPGPDGTWGEAATCGPAASVTRVSLWVVAGALAFFSLLLMAIGISLLHERLRPAARPAPVLPEEAYASPVQRGVAYALDSLLLLPAYLLLFSLVAPATEGELQDMMRDGRIVAVALPAYAACYAITILYFILCEGRYGQTVGKWSVGIQVARLDGGRITWPQSVFRNLVRVVDGMYLQSLLGLLFILSTERSQRLGDLAARTIVLRRRSYPVDTPDEDLE